MSNEFVSVGSKPQRKSYKTLYLNEVKNHQITRDFHEKLLAELRKDQQEQSSWDWFRSFFSAT